MKSVFEYTDYKHFLKDQLPTTGESRGLRAKLAIALNTQTAFVSQVLNSHTHFSLEHAIVIQKFLGLNSEESHFFMLLIQFNRAGTKALENYFEEQMRVVIDRRNKIASRNPTFKVLPSEKQMIYTSSWLYAAIHMAVMIPEYHSRQTLAQKFGIAIDQVGKIVDFLLESGLIREETGKLSIGEAKTIVPADHPLAAKQHINLRLKALDTLNIPRAGDLHFSGIYTLSKSDLKVLKERFLNFISENSELIAPSKEEALCGISLDLFEI